MPEMRNRECHEGGVVREVPAYVSPVRGKTVHRLSRVQASQLVYGRLLRGVQRALETGAVGVEAERRRQTGNRKSPLTQPLPGRERNFYTLLSRQIRPL